MAKYVLHSYWRSSASYRVRIALNLKGVVYETVAVNLMDGDQTNADFSALNPNQTVPVLIAPDGTRITQSLAAVDYLDANHDAVPMLPGDAVQRAQVLSAALIIAMDTTPLGNLRVLQHIKNALGHSNDDVKDWMQHWVDRGLTAFDATIDPGDFCFGDAPSMADLCLIPQLYNARRWCMDVDDWPALARIEAHCMSLPAFAKAAPEAQPDAPKE